MPDGARLVESDHTFTVCLEVAGRLLSANRWSFGVRRFLFLALKYVCMFVTRFRRNFALNARPTLSRDRFYLMHHRVI